MFYFFEFSRIFKDFHDYLSNVFLQATVTVHMWAPAFSTHFEPLWEPFAADPIIVQRMQDVDMHLANVVPDVDQQPIPQVHNTIENLDVDAPAYSDMEI